MGFSKVFRTEIERFYWEVAKGTEEVNHSNFEDLLFLLPTKETMLLSKDSSGKKVLSGLRYVGGLGNIDSSIQKIFLSTPREFNRNVFRGSDAEYALEDAKTIMTNLNTLYGHYSVAVEMLHFLIDRSNGFLRENERLQRKNDELTQKIIAMQKKEDERTKIDIPIVNNANNSGVLLKTDEEKKKETEISTDEIEKEKEQKQSLKSEEESEEEDFSMDTEAEEEDEKPEPQKPLIMSGKEKVYKL